MMQVSTEMFSIGDRVKILIAIGSFPNHLNHLNKIGIITLSAPANKITDVTMYDVKLDDDTFVYFHDELELVPLIGTH